MGHRVTWARVELACLFLCAGGCELVFPYASTALGRDADRPRADGRADTRPPDLPPQPTVADGGVREGGLPADLQIPPTGSYGTICEGAAAGILQTCADGITVCVPAEAGATNGFCTVECTGSDDTSCPQADGDTWAACALYDATTGKWFCLFFCQADYMMYACPPELDCVVINRRDSHCYP